MNTDKAPAELTLKNGTTTITIRPRHPAGADPVICKEWDLGAPEPRYTTVANPGADGTIYSDGFVGARTVTLELAIMGGHNPHDAQIHDAYWYANKLTAMTHPAAQPILEISRADELTRGDTYHMNLRGSPYTLPWTKRSAALLELQLVFTCPLGLLETKLKQTETVGPLPDTALYDWVFPAKFDKTFGLYNEHFPHTTITIGGDVATAPVIYLHGPSDDPHIIGDNTDHFAFTGLHLNQGDTVEIDMNNGTIRTGQTSTGTIYDNMDIYNTVDWTISTFWRWQPGTHTVTYIAAAGSMTIQYRERRITI